MSIALAGAGFVILVAICFVLYKYSRKKPKRALKQGDYVMFRGRYKSLFPEIPTSHALVIEKIEGNNATVVFMTTKSQILKQVVPLYTLALAS